ncbi:molybdopterin-guanine dinucleotide biosynthesis protein B [Clostridium arbusti]|uniref:molybdopterin-guanine dinucleotide biosynthesis protein B n=1 Tax=Clostridium arbusti TaxID=1137848 RepID=UPI000287E84C|nr:molybdopterin-guanine dinucleotide biosynthesis protein B [Clostridium arbusti]
MDTLYSNKKVISIISAKSDMGKTTLIEGLISIFKRRGYNIGVLKYDVKRFEIDREGKDSYRFTKAGADTMIIASSNKLAIVQRIEEEHSIEDVINRFENMDLIIVEGFKSRGYPQIEIHRKDRTSKLLIRDSSFDSSNIIAVATDENLPDIELPQLDLNNVDKVADFIENRLII